MTAAVRAVVPRAPAAAAVTGACAAAGAAGALHPVVVLPVLLACLVAVVMVVWPDAVTPAVVFLVFLNVPAVLVNDHGVPRSVGALVPLLLVVPLAHRLLRRERLIFTPVFLLLLLYLAVQAGSTFVSAYPGVASQKLLTFGLEGIAVYFLVTNVVRTPAALRRAVWAVIAAGSLLAAATIFQQATHTYWRTYGGFSLVDPSYYYGHAGSPRASGPVGDPNYYGQILLVALALALLACWRERTVRLRLAAVASTVAIAIAIVLTSSRGSGVALVAVLAIMACLRYVSGKQLLLVAAGATALLIAFPGYRSHLASVVHLGGATAATGSASASDLSVRGRAAEMLAAALVFENHPVAGVGPSAFPLYYQQYAAASGSDLNRTVRYGSNRGALDPRAAHDMFLSLAAEVGIVGLLVFVAIVLETLWALARARRRWQPTRPDLATLATGLLLAVVAYVTAGLFLTLAYERYFWLLIALAGAAGSLARAEDEPAR